MNINQSQIIKVVSEIEYQLAEGPIWHSKRRSFLWVDIIEGFLSEYRINEPVTRWEVNIPISSVYELPTEEYVLLISREGLFYFYFESNELEKIQSLQLNDELRTNDSGILRDKGIVFGTMQTVPTGTAGSLYLVDNNLSIKVIGVNIGIPNLIKEYNGFLFVVDSLKKSLYKLEKSIFDTTLVDFNEIMPCYVHQGCGTLDGGSFDSSGNLVIAVWGEAKLIVLNPNFEIIEEIIFESKQVTSCCFGGEDGNSLLVTTASVGLNEEDLNTYPESGKIYIVKTQRQGAPMNIFGVV